MGGDHKFDALFRKGLEDHSEFPDPTFWKKISEEIPNSSLDETFKNGLAEAEVIPPGKVWDGVSKALPYNLYVKRTISNFSKIAVVLLIGMFGISGIMSLQENQVQPVVSVDENENSITQHAICVEAVDPVEAVFIEKLIPMQSNRKKTKNDKAPTKVAIVKKTDLIEEDDLFYLEPLPVLESVALHSNKNTAEEEDLQISTFPFLQTGVEEIPAGHKTSAP